MLVGYARVSTDDQRLDLQTRALKAAGCRHIYDDRGQSGAQFSRRGLKDALDHLPPGGTLVVWRLDRLGRSLSGLVKLMEQLDQRKIHFRSVTENIDTASSSGLLMFHVIAALAQFERSIISERTRAGLEAAKVRGCKVGRPKSLSGEQIANARQALRAGKTALDDLAEELGISARTLRRYLALTM